MVRRTIGSDVYNLSYDGENRLAHVVKGSFTADFVYDGDGNRIIATEGETTTTTTVYIGNYFEWTGSAEAMKRHYYAETTRVAMREGSAAPKWLFGDHLGGTSLVANNDGTLHSELRYKAWGETRFSYGTVPTTFRFTGQREESSLGLYHYGARWYDPALSRWIQADSIIPEITQGVQAWDRFAYVNNSPVIYSDPSGHCIGVLAVACVIVGAVLLFGMIPGDSNLYTPPPGNDPVLQALLGLTLLTGGGGFPTLGAYLTGGNNITNVSTVITASGGQPSEVEQVVDAGKVLLETVTKSDARSALKAGIEGLSTGQTQKLLDILTKGRMDSITITTFENGSTQIVIDRAGVDGFQRLIFTLDLSGKISGLLQEAFNAAGELIHVHDQINQVIVE